MMKRTINGWVAAAGFACVMLAGAGCGKHEAPPIAAAQLPPAPVRVAQVNVTSHTVTEDVVGTVRAKLRASIEAKVSGRVVEMKAVEGQLVRAGDLLATLDVQEIRAQLDQALAQREQAEQDLKRFASLVDSGAVTRQEFDAAQARSRVANAAVVQAETMLGYARIAAPFDAVVTRKAADVGDLAVPGKPLLELEDANALRLEADVPEALYGRVVPGATLPVTVPALDRVFTGTVSEVAAAASAGSRTFLVKLDLPRDATLRSGLFGRVAVPVGESRELRVPASALVVRGQLEMVFVAKDGKAQLRLVRTGKRQGDQIGLLSGLSDGETVVVEGASDLRDGQPLEVK